MLATRHLVFDLFSLSIVKAPCFSCRRVEQVTCQSAADAWPLSGLGTRSLEDFDSWLVMGNGTTEPRLTDVPVRMPLPPAVHGGSIYENQKATGRRFFETYKSKSKPAPTRSS